MKRLFRHACAMLAVLLVMSMFTVVNASAANGTTIDTTNAKYGFVTVNYTSNAKLKVGIQYGSEKTSYKNCPSGKDAKTDMDKVTAIYNYIAGHYTYDTKLANDITSGKVSKYIPDTAATLNSNKGICYDLASLFAAMCRSQDIPCTLTKGYAGSSYHAWNKVNVSGNWYQIDMTYAVTKRVINETTFAGCVSPLTYSQQSDTLAVSAVA